MTYYHLVCLFAVCICVVRGSRYKPPAPQMQATLNGNYYARPTLKRRRGVFARDRPQPQRRIGERGSDWPPLPPVSNSY